MLPLNHWLRAKVLILNQGEINTGKRDIPQRFNVRAIPEEEEQEEQVEGHSEKEEKQEQTSTQENRGNNQLCPMNW